MCYEVDILFRNSRQSNFCQQCISFSWLSENVTFSENNSHQGFKIQLLRLLISRPTFLGKRLWTFWGSPSLPYSMSKYAWCVRWNLRVLFLFFFHSSTLNIGGKGDRDYALFTNAQLTTFFREKQFAYEIMIFMRFINSVLSNHI